jgi:acyl-CoA thioester hydrolase
MRATQRGTNEALVLSDGRDDLQSNIYRVSVTPDDIDDLGHVNNNVYLRWTELAVRGHWAKLATAAEQAQFYWIAARHEIDYRRPAFLQDAITATTVVREVRRTRAWYDTVIASSSAVLAEVRSCWCCVDVRTQRLTVIPPEIVQRILPPDGLETSA